MALLETKELRSGYGRVEVLRGISLAVEPGEFISIIGANGAGKTTFLRTLSGVVRARGGHAIFDGEDITKLATHRVPGLGIAHVPEGRQIFPKLSVRENLLVGAYLNSNHERRERQLDLVMKLFPRLEERADQAGGTLSGGEQQMLALGRALMLDPKLMLLDEPSQGLAPKVASEMYEKLEEIHASGTTILLVEQNVIAALRYASRAYVMEQGRIALEGTSDELRNNDEVRRAYLGI